MSSETEPLILFDHEEKTVGPTTLSTPCPVADSGVTSENYPTGQAYPAHYPEASSVSYIIPSKDADEGVVQPLPDDAALLDEARSQARNHAKIGLVFSFCNLLTLGCSIPAMVYAFRKNSTLADYRTAKELGIVSTVLALLGLIAWVVLLAVIVTRESAIIYLCETTSNSTFTS